MRNKRDIFCGDLVIIKDVNKKFLPLWNEINHRYDDDSTGDMACDEVACVLEITREKIDGKIAVGARVVTSNGSVGWNNVNYFEAVRERSP